MNHHRKPESDPEKDARFDAEPVEGGGRAVPAGGKPEPGETPWSIEKVAVLTHELANLLDASIRRIGLARRSMPDKSGEQADEQTGPDAQRHLDVAQLALDRMAELVHAAMSTAGSSIGSVVAAPGRSVKLGEAVGHAVQVLMPMADEHGVKIEVDIEERAQGLLAGPLYVVVLNGLQNAIESIALQSTGGNITIQIRRLDDGNIRLSITDDGPGLVGLGGVEEAEKLFEFGCSTKPDGTGLGLATCRDVIQSLGGTISLTQRSDRSGAVLRVQCPLCEGC